MKRLLILLALLGCKDKSPQLTITAAAPKGYTVREVTGPEKDKIEHLIDSVERDSAAMENSKRISDSMGFYITSTGEELRNKYGHILEKSETQRHGVPDSIIGAKYSLYGAIRVKQTGFDTLVQMQDADLIETAIFFNGYMVHYKSEAHENGKTYYDSGYIPETFKRFPNQLNHLPK